MTNKVNNIQHAISDLTQYVMHKSKMEEIQDILDYSKDFVFVDILEKRSTKQRRIEIACKDALRKNQENINLTGKELIAILPVRLEYHTKVVTDIIKELYEENNIHIDISDRVKSFSLKDYFEHADKIEEEKKKEQEETKKMQEECMKELQGKLGA